jgi:hypothetical protein
MTPAMIGNGSRKTYFRYTIKTADKMNETAVCIGMENEI